MKKQIKTIHIAETDSTNRYLREYHEPCDGIDIIAVSTDFQTAGRGQGTNRWESQRGQNLLMSMKVRPENVPANRQYIILQAAALAVVDALSRHAGGFTIKWPNDIYHDDRKISGTLTECAISRGMVTECVIGIGVNINQTAFTGDAPNPVSLCHITGSPTPVETIMDDIIQSFGHYLFTQINQGKHRHITARYMQNLYRREGTHAYRDAGGDFMATIETVMPDGHLVLRRTDGSTGSYAFKEVTFLIARQSDKPDSSGQKY